jgi:hypothetical protein
MKITRRQLIQILQESSGNFDNKQWEGVQQDIQDLMNQHEEWNSLRFGKRKCSAYSVSTLMAILGLNPMSVTEALIDDGDSLIDVLAAACPYEADKNWVDHDTSLKPIIMDWANSNNLSKGQGVITKDMPQKRSGSESDAQADIEPKPLQESKTRLKRLQLRKIINEEIMSSLSESPPDVVDTVPNRIGREGESSPSIDPGVDVPKGMKFNHKTGELQELTEFYRTSLEGIEMSSLDIVASDDPKDSLGIPTKESWQSKNPGFIPDDEWELLRIEYVEWKAQED